MGKALSDLWIQQAKKRKRRCGAHVNIETLHLWKRKKILYDRMRWQPAANEPVQIQIIMYNGPTSGAETQKITEETKML